MSTIALCAALDLTGAVAQTPAERTARAAGITGLEDPVVAAILQELYVRNLTASPHKGRKIPWLTGSPGYNYRLPAGRQLQFHVYPSAALAARAKQRVIDGNARAMVGLAPFPYIVQCKHVLALYFGTEASPLSLQDSGQCDEPLALDSIRQVRRNADSAHVLRALKRRGLAISPFTEAGHQFGDHRNGFVYRAGSDGIYFYLYDDAASAHRDWARFINETSIDHMAPPHPRGFHCGSALTIQYGNTPAVTTTLTALCGKGEIPKARARPDPA